MGRDKLKIDNFNSTECKNKIAKGQERNKLRQGEQRTHFRRAVLHWRGQIAQQLEAHSPYVNILLKNQKNHEKTQEKISIFLGKSSLLIDQKQGGFIEKKKSSRGLELTGLRVISKSERAEVHRYIDTDIRVT